MNFINPSEIESTFGVEKSEPIIKAFNGVCQQLEKNHDALDNQQKRINRQQSILEEQEDVIHKIQGSFDEYVKGDLDRKTEIKKDLLIELATKADIEKLNGKIDTLEQKMIGRTDALEQKMDGKIDALEQKMDGKIDALEQKMDGKIDALEQKMCGKIDALEQKMCGKIDALEQKMSGRIDTLEEKLNGEFKKIHLWMKMLLTLALLTIACFSPTAQTLIKLIKF
jgi:chromosome segregation ATPase